MLNACEDHSYLNRLLNIMLIEKESYDHQRLSLYMKLKHRRYAIAWARKQCKVFNLKTETFLCASKYFDCICSKRDTLDTPDTTKKKSFEEIILQKTKKITCFGKLKPEKICELVVTACIVIARSCIECRGNSSS